MLVFSQTQQLIDDVVCKQAVFLWVTVDIVTGFLDSVPFVRLLEYFAKHNLDSLDNLVLVVPFEQLITRMEDVQDLIRVLNRVAQSHSITVFRVLDDSGFVHQKFEVHVDVVDT
jgi:hypothetical protein